MDPAILISVLILAVGMISLTVAVIQSKRAGRRDANTDLHETIRQVITESNAPLKAAVDLAAAQVLAQEEHLNRVEAAVSESTSELKQMTAEVTSMAVKVDFLWDREKNSAR